MAQHHLQSEEYVKFFDDTPVAFIRTDLETGEFLMGNKLAAEMLGFDSVDDLIEHGNSRSLYPNEERQKLIKALKRNGEVKRYELRFTLPNGEVVWAAANLHINCGGSCIEGVLVDITETKKQEVDVRNSQLKRIQDINAKIAQVLSA